jgi:hypothetical protein
MARRIAASRLLAAVPAAAVAALVLLPGGSSARATHDVGTARMSVAPAAGGPRTSFVISFRAPQRTARHAGVERRYLLSVAGPAGQQHCLAGADRALPFARAHAHVKATLDPATLGGRWCQGAFRGRIEEIQEPVCPRNTACPRYVILLGTIGRFKFDVRPPGAADTQPPKFAGLKAANACTPGPQRPGQTTPFTLTWDPATDDVTPSAEIVYDVYESGTAGGEDFSHPSWTTPPGATTFATPGLPSHGTFYFVVRARDQAGNEDRNRVELRGSDPCL